MTNAAEKPPETQLGRRIAGGAKWLVSLRIGLRLLGLINIAVLARLLAPEDFGLIALGMAALGLLTAMAEFRPDLALIRERSAEQRHYNTVWTLSVIRGVIIASIIAIAARYYAQFFEEPRLVLILYVFAISAIIEGFQNVGVVDFFKKLELDRQFRFMLVSRVIVILVTWIVAVIWRNYWALVVGAFLEHALPAILSYRFHPYRPSFDLSVWRRIVGFSSWLMLNNLLRFLNGRASTFFIGKLADTGELGRYSLSQRVIYLPGSEIVAPMRQAVYPGYAKIADDRARLRQGFVKVFGLVLLAVMPVTVGLGLVIDPVVRVFFGEKWAGAIPIMEVLVLSGVFRVSTANVNPLLLAIGRPGLLALINFLSLLALVPLLLIGVKSAGAVGAAWAAAASSGLTLLLSVSATLKALDIKLGSFIGVCWRPAVAVSLMSLAVITMDSGIQQIAWARSDILRLALLSSIAAGSYILAILLLWMAASTPPGAELDFVELIPSRAKVVFARLSGKFGSYQNRSGDA